MFPAFCLAQFSLTGTNYTQNYNSIGNDLPTGWLVETSASSSSLGTSGSFTTTAATWVATTGAFRNVTAAAAGSTATTSLASLNFSSGLIYVWQLNAFPTSNAGTDYDQIVNSGAIAINYGAILTPSFTGTATAPNLGDTFWNTNHSWTVIANSSGTITGTAYNLDSANTAWSSAGAFTAAIAASTVTLNWVAADAAIPEPSTYAALLGAATPITAPFIAVAY